MDVTACPSGNEMCLLKCLLGIDLIEEDPLTVPVIQNLWSAVITSELIVSFSCTLEINGHSFID